MTNDVLARVLAECPGFGRLPVELDNRLRQLMGTAGLDQQAALAIHDELRNAADAAADDGHTRGEGLENDHGLVFIPERRYDERPRVGEQSGDLLLRFR